MRSTVVRTCIAIFPLALFALAPACSSTHEDRAAAPTDDAPVEQTIVHVGAAGVRQVTTRTISAAEARAEADLRAARLKERAAAPALPAVATSPARDGEALGTTAEALHVDAGCGGASLWLYDQPNRKGKMLCVVEDTPGAVETFDLGTVCHRSVLDCSGIPPRCSGSVCVETWSFQPRSLWAGDSPGYFFGPGYGCLDYFAAGEIKETLSSCAQNAGFFTYSRGHLTKVWRLMKPNDHFYTTSDAERDDAAKTHGYVFEGAAFQCWTDQAPYTIPLYRMYDSGGDDHFYTTNAAERANAISNLHFKDEGILCWVYPASSVGSVPATCALHRLYSDVGHHFYTINKNEATYAANCLGYGSEDKLEAMIFGPDDTSYRDCNPLPFPPAEAYAVTHSCGGSSGGSSGGTTWIPDAGPGDAAPPCGHLHQDCCNKEDVLGGGQCQEGNCCATGNKCLGAGEKCGG